MDAGFVHTLSNTNVFDELLQWAHLRIYVVSLLSSTILISSKECDKKLFKNFYPESRMRILLDYQKIGLTPELGVWIAYTGG